MKQGSRKSNKSLKVKYITDLLDQSYQAENETIPGIEKVRKVFNQSIWEKEKLELRSQWKNRTGDRRKRRNR
jgi:hypothetical protein